MPSWIIFFILYVFFFFLYSACYDDFNKKSSILFTKDVFENVKQYGKFNAIILTYFISASLHGLNFQLAAVLLSIGIFSYVEFRLRNLLAEILDACVNAHKCTIDVKTGVCLTKGHENTSKIYWVKLINFIFAIFTMILLSYLGVLLDTSADHGNDFWLFTNLKRWSDLHYFGHIIVLIWYLIYLTLSRWKMYYWLINWFSLFH